MVYPRDWCWDYQVDSKHAEDTEMCGAVDSEVGWKIELYFNICELICFDTFSLG